MTNIVEKEVEQQESTITPPNSPEGKEEQQEFPLWYNPFLPQDVIQIIYRLPVGLILTNDSQVDVNFGINSNYGSIHIRDLHPIFHVFINFPLLLQCELRFTQTALHALVVHVNFTDTLQLVN